MDFNAIRRAYPSIRTIDSSFVTYGLNEEGEQVPIDQALVDAARVELDAEYALVAYKDQRKKEYPDWQVQLDYIYHHGIDAWKADIVDPVKAKYPKPE